MKYLVLATIFVVFASFQLIKTGSKNQPCIDRLDGKVYQYNMEPQKPNMSFSIIFYCENDSMRGGIIGPVVHYAAKPLFFRATVYSVKVKGDSISFTFIPGELYGLPFTIRTYQNYNTYPSVGFDADRMYYRGTIQGDSIIRVKCTSKYLTCLADSMVLRKTKP